MIMMLKIYTNSYFFKVFRRMIHQFIIPRNNCEYPFHYASEQSIILMEETAGTWTISKAHEDQHQHRLRKVKNPGQGCGFHSFSGGSVEYLLNKLCNLKLFWILKVLHNCKLLSQFHPSCIRLDVEKIQSLLGRESH